MTLFLASLDFGYPWALSYGHLTLCAVAAAGCALAFWRGKRAWWVWLLAALALWAFASFCVLRLHFNAEAKATLPTQNFLAAGSGRVIDLGAGTGRSTVMVLEARPRAEVVAVDLFEASFDRHFGSGPPPEERLRANLRAAGVEARASIQKADIRQLPFPPASFDAAVSAYVIDHLGRDGARQAFAEAARVLKPGGDLLFLVIANDAWVKFAFGPLLTHSTRRPEAWASFMQEAGFQIVEQGTPPAMLYIVGRKL